MYRQKGFTLIELVVVIVILGLLAATALPKFINLTSDARSASINGVAGGLRSAVALARAQYVVTGSTASTNVVMDNQNVTVLDEQGNPGKGGVPTEVGIRTALSDPDGYGVAVVGTTVTYSPTNGGSAGCQVQYDGASGAVTASTGSC